MLKGAPRPSFLGPSYALKNVVGAHIYLFFPFVTLFNSRISYNSKLIKRPVIKNGMNHRILRSFELNFAFAQTITQGPDGNWFPPYPIYTDDDSVSDHTTWELMGSVVTANAESVVMHLECPSSTDCGVAPHQTLTYGRSTWKMDMADGPAFTMTQDCDIFTASPASMVCRESAGGSEANFPGSSTTTYGYGRLAVSVTSGWDDLRAPDSTGAAMKPTTGAEAKSGSTPSQTLATATMSEASGTPTGNKNSTAPKSTGAAPMNSVGLRGHVVAVAGAGLLAGLVL